MSQEESAPSAQRAAQPARLAELQLAGRLTAPPLFTSVPRSCQAQVQSLVDADGDLKSVVLLGFTRDGGHLVSYTTQPVAPSDHTEGHALQLWTFQQGAPCRRLWSVPLFRTQHYMESLASEEHFLAGTDDKFLTVAESPDSSLLVVHARSADPTDAASRDSQLANFLTIIPGPLHAGAAQLKVVHLSYHTSFPHAAFSPFHFLTPLEGDPAMPRSDGSPPCTQHASTLAVALYTGAVVRYVHASASRQAAHPLPATHFGQPQSSGDDENGSSASRFPSPEPASSSHARPLAASPAGQRTPLQPPALRLGSPQQHRRRQQQQQRQSDDVSSPSLPASPRRMPWQRHGQLQRASQQAAQEERWPTSPCSSTQGDELEVQTAFVPCVHAYSSVRGSSSHSLQKHQQLLSCTSGGGKAMAAVRLAAVPSHLDLEACIYDALRQQGLPPAALEDYAAAPVQGGEWQGYDGLLLLAVLRLARAAAPLSGQKRAQPPPVAAVPAAAVQQEQARRQAAPHRSACVLLHAAAVDGAARLLEWLEPPYPWHDDLSAFLVQQTAVAGLAFEKAAVFFADFLARRYGSVLPPRSRLPLVLTNRTVLGSGTSLPHIVHPWLPQAILGWGGGRL